MAPEYQSVEAADEAEGVDALTFDFVEFLCGRLGLERDGALRLIADHLRDRYRACAGTGVALHDATVEPSCPTFGHSAGAPA